MKRRICTEVIRDMMVLLPDDQHDLRKALEWNYEDALYKAPEETLQWVRTMQTLQKYIPNPSEDWHFKVLSIFTTRTVDELRIDFKE